MKIINFFAAACMLFLTVFFSFSSQAESCQSTLFEVMDNCPTASFSIENNGNDAGTPIRFTNHSSGANSYLWDFGDGNSSTDENPTHVYGAAGTYTVKLYATFGGCTVEFIGTEDVITL